MARPANADAAATRQRILESAISMFAARGMGQTSVREIAKGAGVSLGMVHHYFGSKDALYVACEEALFAELAELRTELVAPVLTALNDGSDGETLANALEALVRSGFHFAREHSDAVRFAMRQVVETGAIVPRRREEVLLPFLDQGTRLLALYTGRPAGGLRLPLQSFVFLVSRYALGDDAEHRAVTGQLDATRALAAVEDHLVQLAHSLFTPSH